MIAGTRRAFGITLSFIASVSIAAPAVAAPAEGGTDIGKSDRASLSHRAAVSGRLRAGGKAVHKPVAAPGRGTASGRARTRDIPPYTMRSTDHLIRRASLSGNVDHNLIDDGTLWREKGHLATWQQTGMASWYGGKRWQGHATSSGATFDENALTAAHATLPLGTKVRVVTHNGARSVIVTINDRPGTRTRIIDLSREAARQLGIIDAGIAMVTLQPM